MASTSSVVMSPLISSIIARISHGRLSEQAGIAARPLNRPCLVLRCDRTQPERTQRWHAQLSRCWPAVPWNIFSDDRPHVDHTGSAELFAVSVEDFLPLAAERQPHAVALVRCAGKVRDADKEVLLVIGAHSLADMGDHVVIAV